MGISGPRSLEGGYVQWVSMSKGWVCPGGGYVQRGEYVQGEGGYVQGEVGMSSEDMGPGVGTHSMLLTPSGSQHVDGKK